MTRISSLFSLFLYFPSELGASTIKPNIDKICNSPSLYEVAGIHADQRCIEHKGVTRCWYTYIPETAKISSEGAVPLIFDLHGYNLCAVNNANITGWARVAEKFGSVVVWPQGNMNADVTNNPCWSYGSCCCSLGEAPGPGQFPPNVETDDIGFLRQIAANVVADALEVSDVTIDTKRLYFGGHSNGAMLVQAMAAQTQGLVAAVCSHASSLMVAPSEDYVATPIHVVYGDLDTMFDFFLPPILDTWAPINGCTVNNIEVDKSGLYETQTWSKCFGNTTVETVKLYNVGHFPYLGISPNTSLSTGAYPGAVTPSIDTTLLSWNFCSKYQLDSPPKLPSPVSYIAADMFNTSFSDSTENSSSGITNGMTNGKGFLLSILFIFTINIII
mmetsp:Transcript_11379/g.11467  ORF Transcript_11379/g.11467 Transcript_11379/m.11467 type:complete len:387 (-) Transcript_11379:263-1423(-)